MNTSNNQFIRDKDEICTRKESAHKDKTTKNYSVNIPMLSAHAPSRRREPGTGRAAGGDLRVIDEREPEAEGREEGSREEKAAAPSTAAITTNTLRSITALHQP